MRLAVQDRVVDRGAQHVPEGASPEGGGVVQVAGCSAPLADEFMGEGVQVEEVDADHCPFFQSGERAGDELAGCSHLLDLRRRPQFDHDACPLCPRGPLTMVEVGARAHVSMETLRKIETGRSPSPEFFTIASICSALGITMEHLVLKGSSSASGVPAGFQHIIPPARVHRPEGRTASAGVARGGYGSAAGAQRDREHRRHPARADSRPTGPMISAGCDWASCGLWLSGVPVSR